MSAVPDPTPQEARALILGTAGFWAGWGLSVPLITNQVRLSLVAFFITFGCGVWLYFGGVYRIWARSQGLTVMAWYFRSRRQLPWRQRRAGEGWGWMRLILPSYYRRAARVLGWSEIGVLVLLGALLVSDVAAAIFLLSHAPN
jgi:hypothetical protein